MSGEYLREMRVSGREKLPFPGDYRAAPAGAIGHR